MMDHPKSVEQKVSSMMMGGGKDPVKKVGIF
jgi:hypothetical protein